MGFILYTTLCILYGSMLVAAAPPVAATALAAISQIGSNTPPNYAFRLPAELWFCIFGLVAHEMHLVHPILRTSAYDHYPELLLSHICWRFRLFAHQMHWLWRTVPLHPLYFRDRQHFEETARIVRVYIAHCGDVLPITVVVRDKFDSPIRASKKKGRKAVKRTLDPAWDRTWNVGRAAQLLRGVLPVAHRWRDLIARVEKPQTMRVLFDCFSPQPFEQLANINLEVEAPMSASAERDYFVPINSRFQGSNLLAARSLLLRGIDFNAVQIAKSNCALTLRISTSVHESGTYDRPHSDADNLQSILGDPTNQLAFLTIDCETEWFLSPVHDRTSRVGNQNVRVLTVSAAGLAGVAGKIDFTGAKRLVVIKVPDIYSVFRDLVMPDLVLPTSAAYSTPCRNMKEFVIEIRGKKAAKKAYCADLFKRLGIMGLSLTVAPRSRAYPAVCPQDGQFSFNLVLYLASRLGRTCPALRSITINALRKHLNILTAALNSVMPYTYGRVSRDAQGELMGEGISDETRATWSVVDDGLA